MAKEIRPRKMKCKCGYEWTTMSDKKYVTCPNCLNKTIGVKR
jgi:Zn finger protein HypA/HybF involved in hydrogenase expression